MGGTESSNHRRKQGDCSFSFKAANRCSFRKSGENVSVEEREITRFVDSTEYAAESRCGFVDREMEFSFIRDM